MRVPLPWRLRTSAAVLGALAVAAAVLSGPALALTAEDYRSLRTTWKLGYVVGIAHGRALYRAPGTGSREAAMDSCIPQMSDVEIVKVVDAYLDTNPALASRAAGDVVVEAIAHHCAGK